MKELTPKQRKEFEEKIRSLRLYGWAGGCGRAAIEINKKVFGGKGELAAGLNEFWLERGRWVGHIAVAYGGAFWDASGEILEEDLVAWGMLDPDDPEYFADGWDEDAAYKADIWYVSEDEVNKHMNVCSIDESTNTLQQLIESLVDEVFSEAKPEAPKKSIAGEFLWADPENGVRRDDAEEKDSRAEAKALKGISAWYYSGMQSAIKKALPVIEDLIDEGHYAKYFTPPDTPMYRWLSKMEVTKVAKVFKLDVDELLANKNQVQVFGPGTLRPQRGNNVTSWTVDPSLDMLTQMSEPRAYYTTVLIKANPKFGGNKFLLNPTELLKTFDPDLFSSFLADEMETIAVGDVHYDSIAVFYADKMVDDYKAIAQEMIAAL